MHISGNDYIQHFIKDIQILELGPLFKIKHDSCTFL